MMYNTQNYWVFGLCPSYGILDTRRYDVSETGYIRPQLGGRETPTLLGPLEGANLNHWSGVSFRLTSSVHFGFEARATITTKSIFPW
jgi:hypothetical protein